MECGAIFPDPLAVAVELGITGIAATVELFIE